MKKLFKTISPVFFWSSMTIVMIVSLFLISVNYKIVIINSALAASTTSITTILETGSLRPAQSYLKPIGSQELSAPVCESIILRNPQISLAKGNYWIYKGSAEWTPIDGEIIKSELSLKMEVLDVVSLPIANSNDLALIALVKGNPAGREVFNYMAEDYSNRSQMRLLSLGLYTVYTNNGKDYYISEGRDEFDSAKKGLAPFGGELISKTKDLKVGNLFGCYNEEIKRSDTLYCWNISSKKIVNQKNLVGNLKTQKFYQYNFIFETLPDDEQYSFAPGLGIIASSYRHHGSVMEYNLTLTEYNISNTVKICPVVY